MPAVTATQWPGRSALQHALERLDADAADDGDPQKHLLRAALLHQLRRDGEMVDALLRALALDWTNAAARERLALWHYGSLRRRTARSMIEEVLAMHPSSAHLLAVLGNLLAVEDPERAQTSFERALAIDPHDETAHRGLCSLWALAGDAEGASKHRRKGYASGAVVVQSYRGDAWPVPLLLLLLTDGGNVYAEHLLDDGVYQVAQLYVEAFDEQADLPVHAAIVNGIADADLCPRPLEIATRIAWRGGKPVVNAPQAVLETARARNAERLGAIDGIRTPRIADFDPRFPPPFPFLLRARGYHMGRCFAFVDDGASLRSARSRLGEHLLAIEYIDTRGADGFYRKYRALVAGDALLPLHLAIAEHWNVHYFSALTHTRAEFRAEEAAFLSDMPRAMGERAMEALERIRGALGLDYGGIDFAFDTDGALVVFEANAAMTILPPARDEALDYRAAAVERAISAVRSVVGMRLPFDSSLP